MNVAQPRVFTIAPGAPFLRTLAASLVDGAIVPSFEPGDDPLRLAEATIFVPTRRAARELRAIFAALGNGRAALLPTIRPLGDFDEDAAWFDEAAPPFDTIDPPIDSRERLLLLTPLVQAWKRRLPAHVASMFTEQVVVPTSTAEAIWLTRDLAALMDEVETEEADWTRLDGLVDAELAAWWQVTLDFLQIVTRAWPDALAELRRSNPAGWRSRLIDAETARLLRSPPAGPVVAAGSTGSIPATARLLAAISRLPQGAVVLPGLDPHLDAESWSALADPDAAPSVVGHPQYGLRKLIDKIGIGRDEVRTLGAEEAVLAARSLLVSQALRPAETTEAWAPARRATEAAVAAGALDGLALVEAPNEREEALAAALALRRAASVEGSRAALVTPDRALARRVASELARFGVSVDDSAGVALPSTPPATLAGLMVSAAMRPGDPVPVLSFLKHPLLTLGLERVAVRRAAEVIELVALRGGVGRPDLCDLAALFEARLAARASDGHAPRWTRLMREADIDRARTVLSRLQKAVAPLAALRGSGPAPVSAFAAATALSIEEAGRAEDGTLAHFYRAEAGERLAEVLRSLVASQAKLSIEPAEWPDVFAALIATEAVKPRHAREGAVSIWGTLEARLQHVDLLVCAGLNEGAWPVRTDPGGFMSRVMKAGLHLDPPERRIGQAAHDFAMALGQPKVVLTRSLRAGDAPSVPSRWVQRLTACMGEAAAAPIRARGDALLAAARHHAGDRPDGVEFAARPNPKPPLAARPRTFSVTEIETLRRDPYAIYARRILGLEALDDMLRDPGAAERGSLFHDILHRFTTEAIDPAAPDALERLIAIARQRFDEEALPADVDAVWWPRFRLMAPELLAWERRDRADKAASFAEVLSERVEVGATGVMLRGRADRIDIRKDGDCDILDYKTGSSPSRKQAHTLVAPQLPLEGALTARGAFAEPGRRKAAELAYVRLRASGDVEEESILKFRNVIRPADELAEEAWARLEKLLAFYNDEAKGYLSRALPFREGDTDGDYDHLARVHEWSAGGEGDDGEGGE